MEVKNQNNIIENTPAFESSPAPKVEPPVIIPIWKYAVNIIGSILLALVLSLLLGGYLMAIIEQNWTGSDPGLGMVYLYIIVYFIIFAFLAPVLIYFSLRSLKQVGINSKKKITGFRMLLWIILGIILLNALITFFNTLRYGY